MTGAGSVTDPSPLASAKGSSRAKSKRAKSPGPSKLSARAREALARTAAYYNGVHPPRINAVTPNSSAALEPGDRCQFTDAARKFHEWKQRTMQVVVCTAGPSRGPCTLCQDGRWVAVDEPAAYDYFLRQHYACTKLKKLGTKTPKPVEEEE